MKNQKQTDPDNPKPKKKDAAIPKVRLYYFTDIEESDIQKSIIRATKFFRNESCEIMLSRLPNPEPFTDEQKQRIRNTIVLAKKILPKIPLRIKVGSTVWNVSVSNCTVAYINETETLAEFTDNTTVGAARQMLQWLQQRTKE